MIRNHVRAMMTLHKLLQSSIRAVLCFSIVYAMHESSFKPVSLEQKREVLLARARFVHDLQEEISKAEGSQREWLTSILRRYEQIYGKNSLVIPRPVIPARPKSPSRISGELIADVQKKELVPSAQSAFVSFVKNTSDTSKL